jgi:hypothetical protein
MQTTDQIIANEARRQELRIGIAGLEGQVNATASAVQRLNSVNSDAVIALQEKREELAALEAGAGPGVTSDFGRKSAITQMIEAEREAAKGAAIDFVKANPDCSEDDAALAWDAAAIDAHPEFPHVIQGGAVMLALYRAKLAGADIIHDATWESQRAWVLATSKAVIMGM